ncbi:hypothetical protein BX616_009211, partial [Lobosporangium transversale]
MSLNRPTICILGCGTMGVAIIRGTLDSMESDSKIISGVTASRDDDRQCGQEELLRPAGFIACVSHEESANKLRK